MSLKSGPQAGAAKPIPSSAQKYQQSLERRYTIQNRLLLINSPLLSVGYGLVNAMVAFAIGYVANSVPIWELVKLFANYFNYLFKLALPTFLAPYSSYLFVGAFASIIAGNLYYAVSTGTHGFNSIFKNKLRTFADTVSFSAPYVSFLASVFLLGASPIAAFKLSWALGVGSGFYLLLGRPMLSQMLEQPLQQQAQPAPPKNDSPHEDDQIDGPRPSPRFAPENAAAKPVENPQQEPSAVLNSFKRSIEEDRAAKAKNAQPKPVAHKSKAQKIQGAKKK
ncbi:MAG: hypothetical protein AB7V32_07510 [Candidatus Berkiella sp.]